MAFKGSTIRIDRSTFVPMPESNRPPVEPTYGEHSLDWWQRRGCRHIEVWCVGSRCMHRVSIPIEQIIKTAGRGAALVAVARRVRCSMCGRKGCHVEPARPPALGTPGYYDWMREEMLRCQRFLVEARERL